MATKLAELVAAEKKVDNDTAIKILMDSKTYELLLNQKSKLYAETVEYIFAMLKAEWAGDKEKFLEV